MARAARGGRIASEQKARSLGYSSSAVSFAAKAKALGDVFSKASMFRRSPKMRKMRIPFPTLYRTPKRQPYQGRGLVGTPQEGKGYETGKFQEFRKRAKARMLRKKEERSERKQIKRVNGTAPRKQKASTRAERAGR